MRYYVGKAEMKWSHKDQLEQIWIQRELGDKLFEEIQQEWYNVVIIRTGSQALPGDTYKRCDVYVDIKDENRALLFALKYPQTVAV
jgi:hypothetical protein|tara:strand:+ start:273 stop:530 length:258 start_codon:yes stop_codon:yes gene_type:complete